MSNLLTTTDKAVQCLHQFARIESVLLTQVNKEFLITLAGRCRLLLPTTVFSLTSSFFLLTLHLLYLRSIGIVGQELAEFHRHDFLDELLFVDIFKIALDILHERTYLLVIDIGLDDLIHHLIELLLTDFLSRRNDTLLKLLSNDLLDIADFELLTQVHDTDTRTLLTGTTRTTRAVGVILDIIGQSVVDDVCQVVNIQSTGSHIGSHQQLYGMLTELLHGQVTLLL